jgi:hypothetical protein
MATTTAAQLVAFAAIREPVTTLVVSLVVQAVAMALVALLPTRRNRGRTMNALGRLMTLSETRAAAGVASLIGSVEPAAAIKLAKKNFVALPFEALCLDDFVTNSIDACKMTTRGGVDPKVKELQAKTHSAKLGRVDGFLSHAWVDDATSKWETLQSWANMFEMQKGRLPLVWLGAPAASTQRACAGCASFAATTCARVLGTCIARACVHLSTCRHTVEPPAHLRPCLPRRVRQTRRVSTRTTFPISLRACPSFLRGVKPLSCSLATTTWSGYGSYPRSRGAPHTQVRLSLPRWSRHMAGA